MNRVFACDRSDFFSEIHVAYILVQWHNEVVNQTGKNFDFCTNQ